MFFPSTLLFIVPSVIKGCQWVLTERKKKKRKGGRGGEGQRKNGRKRRYSAGWHINSFGKDTVRRFTCGIGVLWKWGSGKLTFIRIC